MFKKLFIDHPESVNETYTQHFSVAMSFSMKLFKAAFASLIHAFIPGFCVKTGSKAITDLHHKMVTFRVKNNPEASTNKAFEESIEYMI
ncbi:DUF6356 family protein [uncultured Paraglaciecola sp.]|uniref:DUF6356 family protein n=1 Tax=uncultured Paraglaciecola sp. TaxID=1765024 RepID=UPI002605985C|nr:DUF6356 family protein [uncultured Paraglaciecola sp.]